jgi:hypothetical protein
LAGVRLRNDAHTKKAQFDQERSSKVRVAVTGGEYFTTAEYDLSSTIPTAPVWKQRMFDWGLKSAFLWVIFTNLHKLRD